MNNSEVKSVEDFGSALDRIVANAERELRTHRRNAETNVYTIRPEDIQYEVDLNDVVEPGALLSLIVHLSEKSWFTMKDLRFLIRDVCKLRGWPVLL